MAESAMTPAEGLLQWLNQMTGTEQDSLKGYADGDLCRVILEDAFEDQVDVDDLEDMEACFAYFDASIKAEDLSIAPEDVTADASAEVLEAFAKFTLLACFASKNRVEYVQGVMQLPPDCQEALKAVILSANQPSSPAGSCRTADTETPHSQRTASTCDSAAGSAASGDCVEFHPYKGMKALQRENAQLRQELQDAQAALAAAPHHQEGGASLEAVQAGLDAARRADAAEREVDQLRREVRTLRTSLNSAQVAAAEVDGLKEQLDVLRAQAAKAQEAEATVAALRGRLETAQEAAKAQAELEGAHAELLARNAELQREAGKVGKLTHTLEQVKSSLVEAELQSSELSMEAESAKAEVERLTAALVEATASAAAGGSGAVSVVCAEAPAPVVGSSLAGGVSEFNPAVAAELAQLREANESLKAMLDSESSERVVKLETLLENTRSLRWKFESKYKETAGQLKSTQSSLESVQEQLAKATGQVAEGEALAERLEGELQVAHSKHAAVVADLAALQATLDRVKTDAADDCAALRGEVERVRADAAAAGEAAAATLAQVKEAAAQDSAAVQAELRQLREQVVAELEAANAQANAEVARVEAELAAVKQAHTEAQSMADEEAAVRAAQVQEQLCAMREEAAARLAEAEASFQAQLAAQGEAMAAYQAQHQVSTEQHVEEVAALQRQAEESARRLEGTEGAVAALQGDLATAREKVSKQAALIERGKEQLKSLKADKASLERRLGEVVAASHNSEQASTGPWAALQKLREDLKYYQGKAQAKEQQVQRLERHFEAHGFKLSALDTEATPLAAAGETGTGSRRVTRSAVEEGVSKAELAAQTIRRLEKEVSNLKDAKVTLDLQVADLEAKCYHQAKELEAAQTAKHIAVPSPTPLPEATAPKAQEAAARPVAPAAGPAGADAPGPCLVQGQGEDDDDDEFSQSATVLQQAGQPSMVVSQPATVSTVAATRQRTARTARSSTYARGNKRVVGRRKALGARSTNT